MRGEYSNFVSMKETTQKRGDKKYFDKTMNFSYFKHQTEVLAEFRTKLKNKELNIAEAQAFFQHEVWLRVSKELNIEYIRE